MNRTTITIALSCALALTAVAPMSHAVERTQSTPVYALRVAGAEVVLAPGEAANGYIDVDARTLVALVWIGHQRLVVRRYVLEDDGCWVASGTSVGVSTLCDSAFGCVQEAPPEPSIVRAGPGLVKVTSRAVASCRGSGTQMNTWISRLPVSSSFPCRTPKATAKRHRTSDQFDDVVHHPMFV